MDSTVMPLGTSGVKTAIFLAIIRGTTQIHLLCPQPIGRHMKNDDDGDDFMRLTGRDWAEVAVITIGAVLLLWAGVGLVLHWANAIVGRPE
jgi:hypothetical protein